MDAEFAAANRRIRMGIERNYLIAMAKLEGITPEAYAARIDAERAAARDKAAAEAAQELGRAYGTMARALTDAANNIAKGFQEAFGSR